MTGAMQPDPAQLADEIETHGLVCVARALDGDEAAETLIVRALRLMAEPAPAEADGAARLKEAARGALAAIHAAILSRPSVQPDYAKLADEIEAFANYARWQRGPAAGATPDRDHGEMLDDATAALRTAADRLESALAQRDEARHVVRETLWMAGRYANGRQTYAVSMYNEARETAEAGGYAGEAEPAVDGGEMAR